jgi:hypothetical protein
MENTFSSFTSFRESGGAHLLERAKTSSVGRTYKGVTIVKVGLGNKRDRNYYPKETLKEAADSGIFNGLRAFADHPTAVDEEILPERSIKDIVGVYTNTKFQESGGGRVVGDLTIFPHANWLSGMVDQLVRLDQADKIGISINGAGKTVPKTIRVSESGEPEEVNYLESFMALRSADVVTEAGAGGGWQGVKNILESASGSNQGKKMDEIKKLQAKLKEAAAKDDFDEVSKIQAQISQLQEAASGKPAAKKKTAVTPAKKEGEEATTEEEGDEVEESAEGAEAQAEEEPDFDRELEEAAEAIKASADGEGTDEESEDEGEGDEESDLEESDDEDEDEIEESDSNARTRRALLAGGRAIRETAARLQEKGGGNLNKSVKAGGKGSGNLSKNVKGAAGPKGKQTNKSTQNLAPGKVISKKVKEADLSNTQIVLRHLRQLEQEVAQLREKNSRLSGQLNVRQSADRAKKKLRESAIPERLRPSILRQLVGKSEDEMAGIIEYHERLVSTVLHEVAADENMDDLDEIEGNGTSLRESYFGGRSRGGDFADIFGEVGLPLKAETKSK